MDPYLVSVLGLAGLFLLLFLGMPIGFALMLVGFLGISYLLSFKVALPITAMTLYSIVSEYSFTVVPLFVIMGTFASISGLSQSLYEAAEKWLRRLPGGLALATIGGCAGFAAICGSSIATAATMGRAALPEMRRYNYKSELAMGTVAAGGTLGFLIPPSVGFVIYGLITEQSIGKLLIAGFFPGFFLATAYMVSIVLWVRFNPGLAPANPEPVSWKERLWSVRKVWEVGLVFFAIFGGMFFGFFTPTEAGAAGAFLLFLGALVRGKLTWNNLFSALLETTRISVMLFFIIAGALVFSYFLALTGVPFTLATWVGGLGVSPYVILAVIVLTYIILGTFLDAASMMVLTLPVLLPTLKALGIDLIWFGVVGVLMMEAGMITPPLGLTVATIAGIAQEPMEVVFRGAIRFLLAIIVVVVIITVFPQIALFLPGLMGR